MVTNRKQHSSETRAKQASNEVYSNPNKIGASTPYDFTAKNLTPYGGLLPVATMLEKIGFEKLVDESVTVARMTKVMPLYQFILAIVLGLYVGFARLNQLRYIAKDPLLAGILKITHLPPQCTLWRFLNSLHVGIARQILSIQRRMREAVWAAGNIQLKSVTIDTDTTVHTLYGKQMGARKSYNPKNKGKKSYQPILSFIGRNQGIRGRRTAQWRSAHREADCAASSGSISIPASLRDVDFCACRFRVLLLGSGRGLRKVQVPIHCRGAQDLSAGG